MSNIQGPYWTADSQEVGLWLVIAAMILASPAIPAGVLGWWLGDTFIGNNFGRWGLMLIFFIATYLFIISLKERKGLRYAIGFVFLEYLLFDYMHMKASGGDSLIMVELVKKFINWGLS